MKAVLLCTDVDMDKIQNQFILFLMWEQLYWSEQFDCIHFREGVLVLFHCS